LLAAAGACSTDYTDASGSADASAEAGGGDATVAIDGGASADAGVDGASAFDAAANSFCSLVDARFCADFDESPNPVASWESAQTLNGGFGADDASFTSPPRSVVFDTTNDAGTPYSLAEAVFQHSLGALPSRVTCAFDLRIDADSMEATSTFAFAGDVSADGGAGSFSVGFVISGASGPAVLSSWQLNGQQGSSNMGFYGFDNTQWNRVRLEMQFDTTGCMGNARLDVFVGDSGDALTEQYPPFRLGPDAGCVPAQTARITLGLAGVGGWRAHYDNVVCDWSP
jgi:hypothetical protein